MKTRFKFVRSSERSERATRQGGHTLYHQLIDLGHTPEQIAAESEENTRSRHIALVLASQDGTDTPLVAVMYGGDYRAEEEWGLPEIGNALSAGRGDHIVQLHERHGDVYLALAATRAQTGEDGIDQEYLERNIAIAHRRSRTDTGFYPEWLSDTRLTMPALRTALKAAGVSPLPKTKAETFALYKERIRNIPGQVSVGEFHDGRVLVLHPVTPVLTDAIRLLGASGKHLHMGSQFLPFSSSATLVDERDFTADTVEKSRAHSDYDKRQRKAAKPVETLLRQRGYLYAFRPGRVAPIEKPLGDYFFINYSPTGHKHQWGWYTLQELREHSDTGSWPNT